MATQVDRVIQFFSNFATEFSLERVTVNRYSAGALKPAFLALLMNDVPQSTL